MEKTKSCFSNPRSTEEAVLASVIGRIVDAVGTDGGEIGSYQIQVISVENPCSASVGSWENNLVQNFMNFKKSGAPSRFLFYQNDAWSDFPEQVLGVLREGFFAGNTTLEVPIDGSLYMFDFLRMSQIDLAMGSQRPIAWIDVDGQCFFPKRFMGDERRSRNSPKIEIQIRIDKGCSEPSGQSLERKKTSSDSPQEHSGESIQMKKTSLDSSQEHSDESPEVSAIAGTTWTGLELLNGGERFYKVVEKLFLAGMRRCTPKTRVTSIYKCSHTGLSGNSRLKAFQMQMLLTKAARGNPNVKYGWYGTSVEGTNSIIKHGFGQPSNRFLGNEAYGIGIHLSPPHYPHTSSLLLEADENGEKHIILCRVIMGNAEKVEKGSIQFHPSSEEFDCGVDDLNNPRCYIVWSTHMNSHILPEYVVSFRSEDHPQGKFRHTNLDKRKPTAANLSCENLFAELRGSLPSSKMRALEFLFNRFKEGKISREVFLRNVRSVAGVQLLMSAAKKLLHN